MQDVCCQVVLALPLCHHATTGCAKEPTRVRVGSSCVRISVKCLIRGFRHEATPVCLSLKHCPLNCLAFHAGDTTNPKVYRGGGVLHGIPTCGVLISLIIQFQSGFGVDLGF